MEQGAQSRGGGVVRGSLEMELAGVLSPYVSFVTGSSGAPLTPASLSPKKTLEDTAPLVSGANEALPSVSLDTHHHYTKTVSESSLLDWVSVTTRWWLREGSAFGYEEDGERST